MPHSYIFCGLKIGTHDTDMDRDPDRYIRSRACIILPVMPPNQSSHLQFQQTDSHKTALLQEKHRSNSCQKLGATGVNGLLLIIEQQQTYT